MSDDNYRRYWGICEDEDHIPLVISLECHVDAGRDAHVPDHRDWEMFGIECPVCGNGVQGGYEGAENITSDEQRTLDLRNGHERGAQIATDILRGIALRADNDPSGVLALCARVDALVADQPDVARALADSGRKHRGEQ